MAFSKITHSRWFKKLNNSLTGKVLVCRGKRIIFNLLYVFVSDIGWQKSQYRKIYGKSLNLKSPQLFAEKVLYLKLFYKNPLLHVCADKHFANEYVRSLGLDNIIIPELGVYSKGSEINYAVLPDKFIVKRTQGSDANLIVDKTSANYNEKKITRYLNELVKIDYFKVGREFGYKGLKSKLQVQPLLENNDGTPLVDYKFYCFEGRLRYYMVSYGEYSHQVRNHKFDSNDRSIDYRFKKEEAVAAEEIELPSNIDEMKVIVEKLAAPFPHVRVDLYNVDGKIYFGEMTFYSSGGFIKVFDEEMDREIASWIHLGKYRTDMFFSNRTLEYAVALEDKI